MASGGPKGPNLDAKHPGYVTTRHTQVDTLEHLYRLRWGLAGKQDDNGAGVGGPAAGLDVAEAGDIHALDFVGSWSARGRGRHALQANYPPDVEAPGNQYTRLHCTHTHT